MESQVWLVRHGQSVANAGAVTSTPANIALTNRGQVQARSIADQIADSPDLIVSSPYLRALDTAEPLRQKFPQAPYEVWPIQEFTYLDPKKCENTTDVQRLPLAEEYWQRGDPTYRDADGVESFADLTHRVEVFQENLATRPGLVIVFGHEQFFRTYLIGLNSGLKATSSFMKELRYGNTVAAIPNAHIIKIKPPSITSS